MKQEDCIYYVALASPPLFIVIILTLKIILVNIYFENTFHHPLAGTALRIQCILPQALFVRCIYRVAPDLG